MLRTPPMQREWTASEYFPPFFKICSILVHQVVFVMFCGFCGIGEVQESICDKCVAEKDRRSNNALFSSRLSL